MAETKPISKPTLDQRRARHAWEAVRRAQSKIGPHAQQDPKKFGGQAKNLPTRIMASGLGQALAFLKAKGYAPGLLQELADWVLLRRENMDGQAPDLLRTIVEGDSHLLRRFTDETLAYLQWLNRFVEAEGLDQGE